MTSFILWYLTVSLIGLAIFPLAYSLLPALPSRGYSLSRALGLLAWGYSFWLLSSLGILHNNVGGLLVGLGAILAVSYWAIRRISAEELIAWWRGQRRLVFSVEVLFLIAFGGWAIVRAANPEIQFTEKPMELAFINAVVRSLEFPPHDPWLSGYAISYYYFGYVLVAMLAQLTAVSGGVSFNLGVALVFALAAIGAFGVLYDLLEVWRTGDRAEAGLASDSSTDGSSWKYAFLGPLFVLILGNLEGVLEVLHARGLFWRQGPSGQLTSTFWKWLDMKELSQPPAQPFSWVPSRFLWWWRASRVVQDYDLAGNWKEAINEFPFFSFLLADLHPHVLAIPFVLLAIGLALNMYLGGSAGELRLLKYRLKIDHRFLILSAVALGGLAFLNTWDFPIYLALFSGAYVLFRSRERGWDRTILWEFLLLGLSLGLLGVVFYLPFYLGFSSQAGGVIPNLIYVTRGAHLWVMFGVFFVPLFIFLGFLWLREGDRDRFRRALLLTFGLALTLFVLSLWMAFAALNIPVIRDLYLGSLGAGGQVTELFQQAFVRRLLSPGGWITLLVILALALGLLTPRERVKGKGIDQRETTQSDGLPKPGIPAKQETRGIKEGSRIRQYVTRNTAHVFAILVILLGALLVLGPEFFYLRDQFGYRINTIFKFYYQAWILFGIAAAYGTVVLLEELRGFWTYVFDVVLAVLMLAALVYPVLSLWTKTDGFNPAFGWTLDGSAYFERQSPDEMAAIQWLKTAPSGVVAEAVGTQYSEFARVATHSGQPTVLGWPGHESQWRGGAKEIGSRQSDIEKLYRTRDWLEAQELLRQYNVRYVYIGALERQTYNVSESKFKRFLHPVFQQGEVTIYEVPQSQIASSSIRAGNSP